MLKMILLGGVPLNDIINIAFLNEPVQIGFLRFVYLDDDNVPCSLQLSYNQNGSQPWMLSILKNPDADPDKRKITVFCSETKSLLDLVKRKGDGGKSTKGDNFLNALESAIGSESLCDAFGGIFINNGKDVDVKKIESNFEDNIVEFGSLKYQENWLIRLINVDLRGKTTQSTEEEVKKCERENAVKEFFKTSFDSKENVTESMIKTELEKVFQSRSLLVNGNLQRLTDELTLLRDSLPELKEGSVGIDRDVKVFCDVALAKLAQRAAIKPPLIVDEKPNERAIVEEKSIERGPSAILGGLVGLGLTAIGYFVAVLLAPATFGASLLIPLAILVGAALAGGVVGYRSAASHPASAATDSTSTVSQEEQKQEVGQPRIRGSVLGISQNLGISVSPDSASLSSLPSSSPRSSLSVSESPKVVPDSKPSTPDGSDKPEPPRKMSLG